MSKIYTSFDEQLNENKCARCGLPFAKEDLKDIGVPGICGYHICHDCLQRLPKATKKLIGRCCVDWA